MLQLIKTDLKVRQATSVCSKKSFKMTLWDKVLNFFDSSKKPKDDKNFSSFGSALPRKAGEVGHKGLSVKSDGSSVNKGKNKN